MLLIQVAWLLIQVDADELHQAAHFPTAVLLRPQHGGALGQPGATMASAALMTIMSASVI